MFVRTPFNFRRVQQSASTGHENKNGSQELRWIGGGGGRGEENGQTSTGKRSLPSSVSGRTHFLRDTGWPGAIRYGKATEDEKEAGRERAAFCASSFLVVVVVVVVVWCVCVRLCVGGVEEE